MTRQLFISLFGAAVATRLTRPVVADEGSLHWHHLGNAPTWDFRQGLSERGYLERRDAVIIPGPIRTAIHKNVSLSPSRLIDKK
jgi:hypothetical protein